MDRNLTSKYVRVPLFKDRPSLRPPRETLRRVLAILAPTWADVKSIRRLSRKLRRNGIQLVAATECQGEVRGEHREAFFPNLLLIEAAREEWDAVVVAGGSGALRVAEDQFARDIVRRIADQGRPVAAMGSGQSVLERAAVAGFASEEGSAISRWLRSQLMPA
jgi:hypothetical protein